jgi:hypothetical protein
VSSLEEPAPKRPTSSANADDQLQERANAMTGRETTIVAGIEIPSTDPRLSGGTPALYFYDLHEVNCGMHGAERADNYKDCEP